MTAARAQDNSRAGNAQPHGADVSILDKTCKACEDFYHYANGQWLKRNPIPPAYPTWGRFDELAEQNREHLRQILEEQAANASAPLGSNDQKIGDFYASCMDEKQIEADGAKPLDPEFQRIAAIQNTTDLQSEIAHLQSAGIGVVFYFGSTQDPKDSSRVIGGAEQGGLGLPDRDYYTKSDEKSAQIRRQYSEHIGKMLGLLGDNPEKAAAEAQTIIDFETTLARASLTRVELRDPEKTYHKMDRKQLRALTPNWSWDRYFRDIGYPGIESVDVSAPNFFEAVSAEIAAEPLDAWKTYLRWHVISTAAPWLSEAFVDESFNFNGHALQGTMELLPRWKRCVMATDRRLGEALGQEYVRRYFPPEAKARAQELVNRMIAALHDDLETLPWMGKATRQQALVKLAAFTTKIGYPDKWRDYSAYKVDRGSYGLNQMRGAQFAFHRELNKIGKPVDRTEWGMSPPTVNAYYDPQMNEIVFPAGILQPPFYDGKADDASNYGAIGAVIGHEMTHGFDDEGRKYDAKGNLRDWWTAEDEKNFDARALCVQQQFDGYTVEDDVHENGKLVLGEAIADLGGLNLAYRAFKQTPQGKGNEAIDGYTPDQRFFLAYGQLWASNDRPEYDRLLVNTNPHPVDKLRSIAAPSNMPQFAQAFSCSAGDAMVRGEAMRCQIW